MVRYNFLLCVSLSIACSVLCAPNQETNTTATTDKDKELLAYLRDVYDKENTILIHNKTLATWNVNTDLNNKTKAEILEKESLAVAKFAKDAWEHHFKGLKPEDFTDPILKREVFFLSLLGTEALDEEKIKNLTNIETKMENIYSRAKVCPFKNQKCDLEKEGLSLNPEIEDIMATSTDHEELEYIWNSWRAASGQKIRTDYKTYVELNNEGAKLNGFSDYGEMWRYSFESPTFVEDLDKLWLEVKPLYDELHRYVFNKLKNRYPTLFENSSDNLIPAHLLGNMWAQNWGYLNDILMPYPNASAMDVTKELIDQGYTPIKMFEKSNDFYLSLGLEPNDVSYNESLGAVIVKPKDKEIVCHASAWDFYDGKDFRIKMCTKVNEEDFTTIHHEMGHIQYYLLYKHLPPTLRGGANPGFHEAVGDTIALSVSSPKHLKKVGLLNNFVDSKESSLNALMQIALQKVVFLPFGLLVDKWRWDVFSGNVSESEWNARWWHYRKTLQKVKPPTERNENQFDPGAKYHVPGDSQYISYFISHILEFQFHRGLCIEAGQYDPTQKNATPLYNCDIYQSKKAGDKLRAGLSLGSSQHWSKALEAITGETKYTGSALIEYFQPLYDYLVEENKKFASPHSLSVEAEEHKGEDDDKSTINEKPKSADITLPVIIGSVVVLIAVVSVITYLVKRKK